MRALDAVLGVRCVGCGLSGRLLCAACVAGLPSPTIDQPIADVDRVLIPCDYRQVVRRFVLDLKVRGLRGAADPLIDAMQRIVVESGVRGEGIAWVPGRRHDIRRRGFDHAEVLAKGLAVRLGLPAHRYLIRRADTADQTSLGIADRWRSVANAFGASNSPELVILVDDLVTTGATASACARALRAAGAESVELVAASRAGLARV
ncbi:MAG TPA: hypothetical protein VHJ82_05775 [Actinomycetota bacterium]|nr:hypothetical protein [Actinomycetota bacterium]